MIENEPDPGWDLFAIKSGYLELVGAAGAADAACSLSMRSRDGHFRLATCRLPAVIGYFEAGAASSCATRTQPARSSAAVCQLPGTRRGTANGRRGIPAVRAIFSVLRLIDSGHEAQSRSALPGQPGGWPAARRPTTAESWLLAGYNPRRQDATRIEL